MANGGKTPPEKKPGATTPEEAFQRIWGNPEYLRARGITTPFTDSLRRAALERAHSAESPAETEADKAGGIAGGGEEKKRTTRRTKQGRAALHGADRTVKVYRLTEAELDRLAELGEDESAAWARASFCGGLLVNVILGLFLASGLDKPTKVAAVVLGVCAAIAGAVFWLDARKKAANGQRERDKIKEAHDFENA